MGSNSRLCVFFWLMVGGCASTDVPSGADGSRPGDLAGRDLSLADFAGSPNDFASPPDFALPPDLMPACLDAGTSCVTAKPGVCSAGHQACSGDTSICVQNVQATAVENCFNDVDDDCNGVVNNGCPITVALGTPRALPAQGGTGGSFASVRCPANTWVVHTEFWFDHADATASGVHIYCSAPTLQRGASAYTIALGAKIDSGEWKGGTASFLDGQIDCGTVGLVGGWSTRGEAGTFVFGMGMDCAAGALTLAGNNQLSVAFSKAGPANYWFYPGGSVFEVTCGANEVIVGYDGRRGAYMDQLQPICAPLTFTYKP